MPPGICNYNMSLVYRKIFPLFLLIIQLKHDVCLNISIRYISFIQSSHWDGFPANIYVFFAISPMLSLNITYIFVYLLSNNLILKNKISFSFTNYHRIQALL